VNKNTSSCKEWDAAMKAYAVASNRFDNVTDKHLVDVATYELKAAEMRLNAVLAGLRDKPNHVQIRNPRTGGYTKIDPDKGLIVGEKESKWDGVREVKPNAK